MKTVRLLILVLVAICISWRPFSLSEKSSSVVINNDNSRNNILVNSEIVTKPLKTYSYGTLEVLGDPFPFIIHAKGNASHLGTFNAEHLAIMTGMGPSITGTMHAANGDEILVQSYNFYFTNDGLEHIDYWITGGTGRFEGATGEIKTTGAVDWTKTPPTFYFNGEGYINIPKSE